MGPDYKYKKSVVASFSSFQATLVSFSCSNLRLLQVWESCPPCLCSLVKRLAICEPPIVSAFSKNSSSAKPRVQKTAKAKCSPSKFQSQGDRRAPSLNPTKNQGMHAGKSDNTSLTSTVVVWSLQGRMTALFMPCLWAFLRASS